MSELVRKAETDIDALRRRLAGLGAAGELALPQAGLSKPELMFTSTPRYARVTLGRNEGCHTLRPAMRL